ncbi:MAG: 3'-5' exonuclease [Candidatus Omnitrophica bacterium]|jgi:DNA polymerase-3 subunit epsilon|nr:3'-5' exonuclease [Candidatus Omnitrophota bacterium]
MFIKKPLVVFDLETTGTWVEKDKIVEIGMVKLMPDGNRQGYVKRVNPGIPIPVNVTKIIGITNNDVKDAPVFKDICSEVLEFIGDCDLGGFNIYRFDLPVLEREIIEAGMSFHWKDRGIYDAQKIYHIHEKRDLMAAYQLYCGKELTNAHTALGDAEATVEILSAQIMKYGSESAGIESLKDIDYETSSYYYDPEKKFCWWNGDLYPSFGKYRRKKHIKAIAQNDRGYLEWLAGADFGDEVKLLALNALNGKFPKAPDNI